MQEAPKVRSPSPPRAEEMMDVPSVKVYGVALPPTSFQQYSARASRLDDDDDDDERDEQLVSEPCPIDHTFEFDFFQYANVTLPPLDYEVHFQLQKQEHHGIGYKPLESLNLFGRDNLFAQPSVTKQINNVKIQGHVRRRRRRRRRSDCSRRRRSVWASRKTKMIRICLLWTI